MTAQSLEPQRQRLAEHLRETVRLSLSGRNGADLPEKPYRLIFAGVLQAPRRKSTAGDLTASAIGMDYRVKQQTAASASVDIAFALYYPVFPTFAEIERIAQQSGEASRIVNIVPWYRRYDVAIADVPLQRTSAGLDVSKVNFELDSAIGAARSAMSLDPEAWSLAAGTSQYEIALEKIDSAEKYKHYIEEAASPLREEQADWRLEFIVEEHLDRTEPRYAIRLMLANVSELPDDIFKRIGEWNAFDARFTVRMPGSELVPFEFLLAPKDYRLEPKLVARGVNCSVVRISERPSTLTTETLPVYQQPYFRTRNEFDKSFARLSGDDYLSALNEIYDEMNAYAANWQRFLDESKQSLSPADLKACADDLTKYVAETERFKLGIDCLRRLPALARAFRLMNQAFDTLAQRSGGRLVAWRLFQIGFIVSELPSIAVRSADLDHDLNEVLLKAHQSVGILWFPTGGGKTEAYLGLIAVSLIFDRLRGKLRGLNTWMRFPLRMLSLQQLERMARVVAVLNEMRVRESDIAAGDEFAIGYFIGGSASPNRISQADGLMFARDAARRSKQRQLMKCPHCTSRVEVEWRETTWSLAHVCSNSACFSNTEQSRGERRGSLPIYIVDDEIYRYLPAILVGTVDKLAGAITRRDIANITSGVDLQCPAHGYLIYGKCVERTCQKRPTEFRRVPKSIDPGPTFLVQDEFHLLRDELGVFAGHYEGLLQVVFSQDGALAPKILAATATIEAYDNQAFQIYLKSATRYPESGWENGESFYATSKPLQVRRVYVGVLGHTRTIEDVAVRIEALYLGEIRRLAGNLTESAVVLGIDDGSTDLAAAAIRLYDFVLAYVTKRDHAGSIKDKQRAVEEYLSRLGQGGVQCSILTGDNNSNDIGETIDRVEREINDCGEPRLEMLAATSLISHGVDLERINCMIVTGMPSHYAEYVQSSSRCARTHPGSVFVCFKSSDAREASQYQSFFAIHEHMDRLIEPIAVNRFASYAPKKTVPGMIVGYAMSYASPKLFRESKISKPLDDIKTIQTSLGYQPTSGGTVSGSLDRNVISDAVREAIGVDRVRPPALESDIVRLNKTVSSGIEDDIDQIGRSMDQYIGETLNCLTSFRDIDEGVGFGTMDSAELLTRLEN